jgi:BirA family transcriptional regulator, biotin operon repressor / biotin---[acetyl-CoA-carboxylase] ligase
MTVSRSLGQPRLHLRITSSTNDRARELALAGAPHGSLVTAGEQSAGRGRQGRAWSAPAGSSLLMSLVVRKPPPLLSLIAGVAVCDAVGAPAAIKWPNDVVLDAPTAGRAVADGSPDIPGPLPKLGGILVEGRPQEGWAVVGIGLNVAVDLAELPPDVRARAASLGLDRAAIEPLLAAILDALTERLAQPVDDTLDAWRKRDALRGKRVSWTQGADLGLEAGESSDVAQGIAEGIDEEGRLLVRRPDGTRATLGAGEVHLAPVN